MKIYNIDTSDYVVAGTTELAAETYADVRGRDAQNISLFKSDDNVIVSNLDVVLTPSFDDTAYYTAGDRIYPEAATTFKENDLVVLTAVPIVGHTFVEWQDGSGTQLSTSAVYSFRISSDTEVVAVFSGI